MRELPTSDQGQSILLRVGTLQLASITVGAGVAPTVENTRLRFLTNDAPLANIGRRVVHRDLVSERLPFLGGFEVWEYRVGLPNPAIPSLWNRSRRRGNPASDQRLEMLP